MRIHSLKKQCRWIILLGLSLIFNLPLLAADNPEVDALVHRWSFNGTLNDSVGQAHATLYNPANRARYVHDNTHIYLNNPAMRPESNPDDMVYIILPDGIISSLGNQMTLEIWFRAYSFNDDWTSLFGFGEDGDGNNRTFNGGTGLIGSYQVANSGMGFTWQMPDAYRWTSSVVPLINHPYMYTMVWDGNSNTGTFYLNGQVVESRSLPGNLADLNDVDNWVGLAYWNDYLLNVSFDEIRIYNNALSDSFIQSHYDAGPDVLETNPCVEPPLYDLDGDCFVGISDLELLCATWLDCGRVDSCM